MSKSMKSIVSTIWTAKGENVYGGKDLIVICNSLTGKIDTYEKVSSKIHEGIIIKDDGTSDTSASEMYGANGFIKATWASETIKQQTKDVADDIADGYTQHEAETN